LLRLSLTRYHASCLLLGTLQSLLSNATAAIVAQPDTVKGLPVTNNIPILN